MSIKANPVLFEVSKEEKLMFAKTYDDSGIKILGEISCKAEKDISFALFDLKKLKLATAFVETDTITFLIDETHLEYEDDFTKFKIQFLDQNTFESKLKISRDLVEKLEFQVEFDLDSADVKAIKNSLVFLPDADVIRFSNPTGTLINLELNKASTKFGDEKTNKVSCITEQFSDFPISVDAFKIIVAKNTKINVKLNTERGFALFFIEGEHSNIKYIISKLLDEN